MRRSDLEIGALEMICVQVRSKLSILMCAVYIPPHIIQQDFVSVTRNLTEFLMSDFSMFNNVIIQGDFNIDCTERAGSYNKKAHQLISLFLSFGFKQLITSTTFPKSGSVLDLLFSNNHDQVISPLVVDNICASCDHLAIDFKIRMRPNNETEKFTRKFNERNLITFKERMDFSALNHQIVNMSAEDAFEHFDGVIREAYEDCFPLTPITTRSSQDPQVRRLIQKKRRLIRKGASAQLICETQLAIQLRLNIVERGKIMKLIRSHSNLYPLFQKIKEQKGSKPSNSFMINNTVISDAQHIAQAFADQFRTVYNEKQDVMPISGSNKPLSIDVISMRDHIIRLNTKKAQGCSTFPSKLIKELDLSFAHSYTIIFNKIIKERAIPRKMKESIITPVHKSGKPKESISSYRPVTVATNAMKLLDGIITDHLNEHICAHKVIREDQYGFSAGRSTIEQVIDLLYDIISGIEQNDCVCVDVIFLDYSSALGGPSGLRPDVRLKQYHIKSISYINHVGSAHITISLLAAYSSLQLAMNRIGSYAYQQSAIGHSRPISGHRSTIDHFRPLPGQQSALGQFRPLSDQLTLNGQVRRLPMAFFS